MHMLSFGHPVVSKILTGWMPPPLRAMLRRMDHPEAFTIWTVREHLRHGYRVTLACSGRHGNLDGELDLQALIDRGLGDKPLRQTGVCCPRCQQAVHFTVHPAKGYGK